MSTPGGVRSELQSLRQEFLACAYPPLKHVMLDWVTGTPDPSTQRFRFAAGAGDFTPGQPMEPFPGIDLHPELLLAVWQDTPERPYKPGRQCRHWVTAVDGLVEDIIDGWERFRVLAERAATLLERIGQSVRAARQALATEDPVERWLLILHEVLKPQRIQLCSLHSVPPRSPNRVPSSETIVVYDNIGMTLDRCGCATLDDLHRDSPKAIAQYLERALAGRKKDPAQLQRDAATEARGKWIYDEVMKSATYGTIVLRLRKRPEKWDLIESPNGIKAAAKRYAERNGLPLPPPRQAGRPPG